MSVGAHIDVRKRKKSPRRTEQVLVKVRSVRIWCGVTKMDRFRKKYVRLTRSVIEEKRNRMNTFV